MRVDNDDTDEAPEDRKRRMARDRKRKQRHGSDYVRAAKKWNPDDCPPGWDHVIWHLALFFEQAGEAYGHGSNGRPVIYSLLESRIETSQIRGAVDRLAERDEDDQPWVRLVKRMMTRFWDYEMDPARPRSAINEFVKVDMFTDMRDWVLQDIELTIKHEAYLAAKARGVDMYPTTDHRGLHAAAVARRKAQEG